MKLYKYLYRRKGYWYESTWQQDKSNFVLFASPYNLGYHLLMEVDSLEHVIQIQEIDIPDELNNK